MNGGVIAHVRIHPVGEGCWPDISAGGDFVLLGESIEIAALPSMRTGDTLPVLLRIPAPKGGAPILVYSSLRLLGQAVDMLRARYGRNGVAAP
jgi:hypothetical protein